MPRNTTKRDRYRRIIKAQRPPCGICKQPIDYTLPYLHPKSFVIDHVIPLNKGGTDTFDNIQAACRDCNRSKSDKLGVSLTPRGLMPIKRARTY